MRTTMEEQVELKITKTAKKERLKMQGMMNMPQGDMVGEEKLKKLLSLKSDKMDMDRLFEIKCNKIDIENVLDIQTIMAK